MRVITTLVIIGCLAMTACREQPAEPNPDTATSISGEGDPAGGGGGGDPRAGRKDRRQRPEMEE